MTDQEPHAEGTFKGTVMSVKHETSTFSNDAMVLAFAVELDDGTKLWPRHEFAECPLNDQSEKISAITKRIVTEAFDLPWPKGFFNLAAMTGQDVEVNIKHRTKNGRTYANAYINPPRKGGEQATQSQIDRFEKRLAGEDVPDEDIPF